MKFLLLVCLSFASSLAVAHGMSAEDQARILNAGYLQYLRLGATHMLSGYDHLLFLFGVIFFLYRLKDVGLYVTLFAIGHSTTLLFGVLNGTGVASAPYDTAAFAFSTRRFALKLAWRI